MVSCLRPGFGVLALQVPREGLLLRGGLGGAIGFGGPLSSDGVFEIEPGRYGRPRLRPTSDP